MPTDNPKISLYVPQQIYDSFKLFQEEKKLSMSQAGIVILAEYFGLKETIKDITEGTAIGGVTLAEFKLLKTRVLELEKKVDQDKFTGKLSKAKSKQNNKSQHELLTKPKTMESISGILLGKRFGMSKNAVSEYKRKNSIEKFIEWSQLKDPDGIAWIPAKKGYVLKNELSDELLCKLGDWISQNI